MGRPSLSVSFSFDILTYCLVGGDVIMQEYYHQLFSLVASSLQLESQLEASSNAEQFLQQDPSGQKLFEAIYSVIESADTQENGAFEWLVKLFAIWEAIIHGFNLRKNSDEFPNLLLKFIDCLAFVGSRFHLKLPVLRSLASVLTDSRKCRTTFRTISGPQLLLGDLKSVSSETRLIFGQVTNDKVPFSNNQIWSVLLYIKAVFITLSVALRVESAAITSRLFTLEGSANVVIMALDSLGCFNSDMHNMPSQLELEGMILREDEEAIAEEYEVDFGRLISTCSLGSLESLRLGVHTLARRDALAAKDGNTSAMIHWFGASDAHLSLLNALLIIRYLLAVALDQFDFSYFSRDSFTPAELYSSSTGSSASQNSEPDKQHSSPFLLHPGVVILILKLIPKLLPSAPAPRSLVDAVVSLQVRYTV
ncbi:hypothetical protein Ciccas_007303 [Cichlidogyrus casuarinus]|uniref:Uncharacterized protein n=1 Tax=Cichlidogyrus casuarinus TaxID=1844966 RepID=A0ABD2Q393_9PLAT